MSTRAMYIWKLQLVINAEGSVQHIVEKASRAKLGMLWIKLADGASRSPNVLGQTAQLFRNLILECRKREIEVWGWHVPHCKNNDRVNLETNLINDILSEFHLSGLIMDAEGGGNYFMGDLNCADYYGQRMQEIAQDKTIPLAISSNDIPQNFTGWKQKFDQIAQYVDYNFPQVYYGGSPSVLNRLNRAINANNNVTAPFAPVGSAWIGNDGGCESASLCAERAREFIRLAHEHQFPIYGFWHWGGAPLPFWEVLNTTDA